MNDAAVTAPLTEYAVPKRVLVAGASGFLGQAFTEYISKAGCTATRLVRGNRQLTENEIPWDPATGRLEPSALEGFDAVINLGGASIATRWTKERKREILESRISPTSLLSRTLARLTQPPGVFLSASAIGFYGSRGEVLLTEVAGPGTGFLAEVCQAWESAADPARSAGIRVVHPRIAVVLSPQGGVLAKLLPIFRAGLGGPLGNGRQYFPWISLFDLCRALEFLIRFKEVVGPVNCCVPLATTQREFTRALARAVHRPAFIQVPAFALIAAIGEAAQAMLLASQRAVPQVLLDRGFEFTCPQLEQAFAGLE